MTRTWDEVHNPLSQRVLLSLRKHFVYECDYSFMLFSIPLLGVPGYSCILFSRISAVNSVPPDSELLTFP